MADETARAESWMVDKARVRRQISPEIHVEQGDKITVTLYLETDWDINTLVLSDIVPGGFEIENPNLVPSFDDTQDYRNVPTDL